MIFARGGREELPRWNSLSLLDDDDDDGERSESKTGACFSNDAHARSYKLEGGCWVGEEKDSLFVQSKPTHKTGFYSSSFHPFRKLSAFEIEVTLELFSRRVRESFCTEIKSIKIKRGIGVAKTTLELPRWASRKLLTKMESLEIQQK